MVTHYRIKITEIDTPFETGKSFIFSLFFHLMIIGILLFSPGLLSEKKRSYITSYKVTLVELPKRKKAVQSPIQDVAVAPAEPAIIPRLAPAIEEPVKPPEPIITKPEEIKAAPVKKKQKDLKEKSKKKERESVQKKKETESITVRDKMKETAKKREEAYIPPPVQSPLSIKKTDEAVASISPPVGDISLDTKEFPYEWYLIGIKNKIENRWSTLEVEILSGEINKVIIKFKILRNGRIERAEIERSSGFPPFDNSALRAVLSSAPLPPLPKDFGEDYLIIHFGFEYKKNG
ncbi:MAG: TonB family protein [Nitrospinae bacterium]|nr:TonB family protein [Nitrospinota bacterium]